MPTSANAHVSGSLTNMALHYAQEDTDFVLAGAAPAIPVPHKTGPFRKFLKEDWYRNEADVRGTDGMFPRVDFRLDDDTFSCKTKGLAVPVSDETVDNQDPVVDNDGEATILSTQGCLRKREIDIATMFTGSSWTAGSAIDATGQEWNLPDGGGIKNHFKAVIPQIRESLGGRMPNLGIMSWDVLWNGVRDNPVVRELIKARSNIQLFEIEDLVKLTGIQRWIIVPGVYNSANKSAAGTAFTAADIWSDSVWVGYIAPTPSRRLPSAAYTFQFRGLRTKVYREESKGAKVVETDMSYDIKQCAADAGQLIQNVL